MPVPSLSKLGFTCHHKGSRLHFSPNHTRTQLGKSILSCQRQLTKLSWLRTSSILSLCFSRKGLSTSSYNLLAPWRIQQLKHQLFHPVASQAGAKCYLEAR